MRRGILIVSVVILTLVFGVARVSSHGTPENFDKPVDNGISRFTYSPLDLIENWLAPFRVELLDVEGKKPIAYHSVWVRFTKEDRDIFSGSFVASPIDGSASLTYFFDTPGQYGVDLRFFDAKNTVIGEASYPLVVVKDEFKPFDYTMLIGPAIGLVVGLVLSFFYSFFFTNEK